jgi:hypothetical protein
MTRRFALLLRRALVPSTLALTACALEPSVADRSEPESWDDAIAKLPSSAVLGGIQYGKPRDAQYATDADGTSRRAYRFDGEAGDEVSVRVRSISGFGEADPRAWLTTSTFKTLASSTDAGPWTKDAELRFTLPKSGTYYVAFADEAKRPAGRFNAFEVRVDSPARPPSTAPIAWPGDPFEVDATAEVMTPAELGQRLQGGKLSVEVGSATFVARQRTCTDLGGCSAWRPVADPEVEGIGIFQTPLEARSRLFRRLPYSTHVSFATSFYVGQNAPYGLTCDFFEGNYPENTACGLEAEPGSPFARPAGRFRTTDFIASQTAGLRWNGRVYADGRYQFVTVLGGLRVDPRPTDTNNQRQIAVYGRL